MSTALMCHTHLLCLHELLRHVQSLSYPGFQMIDWPPSNRMHRLQRIVSLGLCFLGWRLSEIAQHLETIFFQDLNVSFVALNSACNLLYNPVYIYCECTVVLASYQIYLDTCLRAPIDCEVPSNCFVISSSSSCDNA